jgi:hypothetical protein
MNGTPAKRRTCTSCGHPRKDHRLWPFRCRWFTTEPLCGGLVTSRGCHCRRGRGWFVGKRGSLLLTEGDFLAWLERSDEEIAQRFAITDPSNPCYDLCRGEDECDNRCGVFTEVCPRCGLVYDGRWSLDNTNECPDCWSERPCARCGHVLLVHGSVCNETRCDCLSFESADSDLIGPSVARVLSSHAGDNEQVARHADDTPALCDFLGSGGEALEVKNARIAARETEH